jgi:acetylglutamate/LysW-gamma-L-alpha-aminoadipate kinase
MIVVKAGGNGNLDVDAVCADVAGLLLQGEQVVLVHSGLHEDPGTVELGAAATASRANETLVARLQGVGVNAVGLSGLDGRLLEAGSPDSSTGGESIPDKALPGPRGAQIEGVNAALLETLLAAGYVPVVAPLAVSHQHEALEVDGDQAAAAIASALKAETVVILSDVPGLLRDLSDETTVVSHVPLVHAHAYLDRFARGAMVHKVLGALNALEDGVGRVIIADGRVAEPLQRALAGDGTLLQ